MVEEQIDAMLRDMELRMMYQGLRMQDFLKYSGQTMEQLRDTYRQQAEDRVKTQLTLEAITKAEGIEPTDEEIDKELFPLRRTGQKDPRGVQEGHAGRRSCVLQGGRHHQQDREIPQGQRRQGISRVSPLILKYDAFGRCAHEPDTLCS